jgi:hypothetical protein
MFYILLKKKISWPSVGRVSYSMRQLASRVSRQTGQETRNKCATATHPETLSGTMAPPVPDSLLLSFFKETSDNLKKCTTRDSISKLNSADSVHLLDVTRRHLRQVQQHTLIDVVKKFNVELGDGSMSMEDVQKELRQLGMMAKAEKANSKGNGQQNLVMSPDEQQQRPDLEIMNAIKEMNDAERTTFSRCVLASSWSYLDDFDTTGGDGGSATDDIVMLERQDIFDYFSICGSVVKLKEAKRFLKGEQMRILYFGEDDDQPNSNTTEGEEEDPTKHLIHTEQRLIFLEQVLLRGVLGYPVNDPTIVVTEAKRLLSLAKDTKGGDAKLQKAFDDFILAMRLAYCAVWEPGRD